ncbi:TetR/AcrR family transcriptional regulator [Homoserinibacter sp. GY 40078]|uniref:TetR/AcrR family transcriptional regulator n=1 Tax=Homoserinibacter sp. GY 40078 TaxID=2603275 RepID=UPI0011C9551F|nr:TetR family transcriptional regulator [Homoserinibacter sp. GY 40078]TXK19230.1 TetR family transcriptional regulator [Homoserinibacter sp. GY 40078]
MSPDDRRAALVRAAIRVIARGGVSAATTRAIVSEAKMPLGAFHYVFTSRDELLSQVIRTVTDDERMAVELALPGEGATFEQVVVAALDAYLDLLIADPERELALFELAFYGMRSEPDLVGRQYGVYYREGEAILTQLATMCGLTWREPMPVMARRLVVVIDGVTTTWLADRDTPAAREFVRSVAPWIAASAVPVTA